MDAGITHKRSQKRGFHDGQHIEAIIHIRTIQKQGKEKQKITQNYTAYPRV
jgi:hypothetical protein